MSLKSIIFDAGKIFIFVIFFVGLFRYRKLSKSLRYIFYFVLLGAVSQVSIEIYQAHVEMNTMPIGHLYISLSILILLFFYQSVLRGYVYKWIMQMFIIGFIIFSIINPVLIQSIHKYPNFVGAVGALILVVLSVLVFSKIMTEAKIEKLSNEPVFWINSGILFYYAGSFFYNILYNITVANSRVFAVRMSLLFAIFNIIFYGLIGIGFIKAENQKLQN